MKVEGDSMVPDLRDGDVLIVDPDKAFTETKGGVGVVRRDDTCLIRKVIPSGR